MAYEPELERDDLATIGDMDEHARRLLSADHNIRTFSDLLATSVSHLEAIFSGAGRRDVTRAQIQRWLALAAQSMDETVAYEPASEIDREGAVKDNGWRPFATFVVEFQEYLNGETTYRTTIHHIQSDRGHAWSSIEDAQIHAWMIEQVGADYKPPASATIEDTSMTLPAQIAPAMKGEPTRPGGDPVPTHLEVGGSSPSDVSPVPLVLVFDQFRVYQPASSTLPVALGTSRQSLSGSVHSDIPTALEFALRLRGTAPARLTDYNAEIFALNVATGKSFPLGRTNQVLLSNGAPNYILKVTNVTLPSMLCRLQVLLYLYFDAMRVSGYFEMPTFQVM